MSGLNAFPDYASLAIAFSSGLMIGLQREQAALAESVAQSETGPRIGGIRTFPLVALAGGVSGLLAAAHGGWVIVAALLCIFAPLALARVELQSHAPHRDRRGFTSETALLLAFLIGVLATSRGVLEDDENRWLLCGTIAIVVTATLSLKGRLHQIAASVKNEDILAWVKFAVVAIVIVPLLPNVAYGPTAELRVLNPYKLGWMVVLIAGISLVGYVAMRLLGPNRGFGITGLVGGLVSSTAVTLALSNRSKEYPALSRACALGVVLANTIMPLRVVVIAAVVQPHLHRIIGPALFGLAIAGAITAAWLHFAKSHESGPDAGVQFNNPFELGPALKFAALFGVILLITRAVEVHFGEGALYLAGAIAGITDLDAITLSMANLSNGGSGEAGVGLEIAGRVILLAAAANTLFKSGIAVTSGGSEYRRMVGWAFGLMSAAGVLGFAVSR